MTANLDVQSSEGEIRVRDLCSQHLTQVRCLMCNAEPKCADKQIRRKKGRNGTANSGTDIIINEQLCFFA